MNKWDFFKLLFDKEQVTCFASDAKGTRVKDKPGVDDVFFCINALDPYTDHNPTEDYHDEALPRRADHNVICYRNFLIELDGIPLVDQINYVTSKIPVSSIVYSGNKSYHFIVSLETPLASLEDYKDVAERIHKLLPEADKACRNPSRLSRIPGVLRKDTKREQTLLKLNNRINNESLFDILPKTVYYETAQKERGSAMIKVQLYSSIANPDSAITSIGLGGRNAFFHWLGNRLREANIESFDQKVLVDLAYDNLKSTNNFSRAEAYSAARIKGR